MTDEPPATEPKKRGPRAKAPEDLKQRKNISVDGDIVDALGALCDELEEEMGFRPTISQALRNLLLIRRKARGA